MKHYLITNEVHDGENEYEERYLISANNLKEAGRVAEKEIKGYSDGIRGYKTKSIRRISKKDETILRTYGVI